MCGIAGAAGNIFSQEQLQANIKYACKALRHRGPDQQGFYVDAGIALGVSRLAIRDPLKGIQPMERQGSILAFNGELYDERPLKDQLIQLGYSFETDSDTEIFLNAFLEFGPSILEKLTGMFAFGLWNNKTKTLYLGRDRWGEKPLYYTYGEGFLIFASEIKGLKAWPDLNWDISLEDIQIFLRNSYLPHPKTGWKNVFKVTPGSILIWQEGKVTNKRYFTPQIKEEYNDTSDPEDLFRLLHSSVKMCSVSDKPIGAFLSGGIDSTTIAYLLSKQLKDTSLFSLYWDDQAYSEEFYANEVVRLLGLKYFSVKCDSTFFVDHFDIIVSLYDEPFADESMIPTYCLAKFAKERVDVVLTGDGADEFFHGYERYFFKGSFEEYLNVFAATSNETLRLICQPDFIKCGEDTAFLSFYSLVSSFLNKDRIRSWIDINTYLTDDILMKIDRACMGVGLETRSPFLTPHVTNFALKCSMQQLAGNSNRGKEILRSAMKDHLPKLTLERKKMGFGVPLNHWFHSSLKEWVASRLLEGVLLKTGWFSKEGIEKLIIEEGNYSRSILNLLVLELWVRKELFNH